MLIGGYELRAGEHAGFGDVAWAVPFTLSPYVIWTWTDPRAHRWDELAAVALLVTSITLSVVAPPAKAQAYGIGLVLIVVEWRMVARGRAWLARSDELADTRRQLADRWRAEEAASAEWRRQVAAAEAECEVWRRQVDEMTERLGRVVAAEHAAEPATAAGGGGVWGRTKETQTEWLRRELAAGRNYTGEQVAELMGLGSAKTGRDRLAEARRPRLVTEETKEA